MTTTTITGHVVSAGGTASMILGSTATMAIPGDGTMVAGMILGTDLIGTTHGMIPGSTAMAGVGIPVMPAGGVIPGIPVTGVPSQDGVARS